MYSRNRYGNWYQSIFWVIIGIILGQFVRFDVVFKEPTSALPINTHQFIGQNNAN